MSVTLTDVRKTFGAHAAVDGVSVDIAAGEFFVVLGPSGCGKSTLLRLIAGLEPLESGEIRLGGQRVSGADVHMPPESRDVGVVFQSYALWPHMDVRDNVAFPIESAGKSRRAARDEADGHLATVALEAYATRRPAELSGGQRQRVALARCLAGQARTILMDEPLANLDPHLRAAMEEEIAAFHRQAGATTIYITHDQREAMALASRVAVMGQGRFLQVGTPQELHERPVNAEVARFIGRSALVPGRMNGGGTAEIAGFSVPVTSAGDTTPGSVTAVIRPENVRLGHEGLPGRLERVFYRGGAWEALARVDTLPAPLPVSSGSPLVEGAETMLTIESAWLLPDAG